MTEMLLDLLQSIYNRVSELGQSIKELKDSFDSLHQNIEKSISLLLKKISEFSKDTERSLIMHINTLKKIGNRVMQDLKTIQEGVDLNVFTNLIVRLENLSKSSADVLNQDTVNLLISEAINSMKQLKQSFHIEENKVLKK